MYVPSTSKVIAHPDGCKQGNGRPCQAINMPNCCFEQDNAGLGRKKSVFENIVGKCFTLNVKLDLKNYINCKKTKTLLLTINDQGDKSCKHGNLDELLGAAVVAPVREHENCKNGGSKHGPGNH